MGLSDKNRNFFLKRQYIINDESILEKTPISESTIKWDTFIKWEKIAGYYVLYFSKATFLAISKTDIKANDIAAFEQLLSTKIGAKTSIISKAWSWNMIILLIPAIILSLIWFCITAIVSTSGVGILSVIPFIVTALIMCIPVLGLVAEFHFIVRGKQTGSKRMIYISYGLLFLTMILILIGILIFLFLEF
jgi:hypothetical protein